MVRWLLIPIFMALLILSGCGSDGGEQSDTGLKSVTFTDGGAAVPDPVSTTVSIDSNTIHLSQEQSGQKINEWSSSIQPQDFAALQQVVADHNLMECGDVSPQDSRFCLGSSGMSILLGKENNIVHAINIYGIACPSDWPEGVRELMVIRSNLIQKYQP